jgi:hypothetical protein
MSFVTYQDKSIFSSDFFNALLDIPKKWTNKKSHLLVNFT